MSIAPATFPELPDETPRETGLLESVMLSHKAWVKEETDLAEAVQQAATKVRHERAKFVAEAASVYYEVLANAYKSGFTPEDINQYIAVHKAAEGHTPS